MKTNDENVVQFARLPKSGGEGGGGDMLEEKVKKLEERISTIAIDLAVLKATAATKEDLQKEMNSQTWKIVTALVVTVLLAVFSRYFIK
ncbi:Uncharacterised protein [Serratia quinivorans]|uniref:hemolysin XhlA n=1 Tax=Serratia quinivorans TaxID=137545 RepID=UPI002179BF80|nr:hemolysin XhlA [Serratia quinivorans]CAI1788809.1 Uncharacterised protein [Serratia quinivorans]